MYHYSKSVRLPFNTVVEKVTASLQDKGFGVLTTIDVKDTLKCKLNTDFRNYMILGACNPRFAHQALLQDPNIGVLLPCNVVVQSHEMGEVEISAINPAETISNVTQNPQLQVLASDVSDLLREAIDNVS